MDKYLIARAFHPAVHTAEILLRLRFHFLFVIAEGLLLCLAYSQVPMRFSNSD